MVWRDGFPRLMYETDGPDTRLQSSKPLVELKGRKFTYNEEAAPWSVPKRRQFRQPLYEVSPLTTRTGLLRFDTILLDHEEDNKKLSEIPTEFHDVVAMVGHEQ